MTTFVQLQEELPRGDEGPPTPELRSLRQTLDELGGWDVVTLHGGRALFGDVRGLPELGPEVTAVAVHADRGALGAVFKAPTVRVTVQRGAEVWEPVEVSPDAEVVVRPAGRRKTESYALRHVLRIELRAR